MKRNRNHNPHQKQNQQPRRERQRENLPKASYYLARVMHRSVSADGVINVMPFPMGACRHVYSQPSHWEREGQRLTFELHLTPVFNDGGEDIFVLRRHTLDQGATYEDLARIHDRLINGTYGNAQEKFALAATYPLQAEVISIDMPAGFFPFPTHVREGSTYDRRPMKLLELTALAALQRQEVPELPSLAFYVKKEGTDFYGTDVNGEAVTPLADLGLPLPWFVDAMTRKLTEATKLEGTRLRPAITRAALNRVDELIPRGGSPHIHVGFNPVVEAPAGDQPMQEFAYSFPGPLVSHVELGVLETLADAAREGHATLVNMEEEKEIREHTLAEARKTAARTAKGREVPRNNPPAQTGLGRINIPRLTEIEEPAPEVDLNQAAREFAVENNLPVAAGSEPSA